jgi:hypothetical protein
VSATVDTHNANPAEHLYTTLQRAKQFVITVYGIVDTHKANPAKQLYTTVQAEHMAPTSRRGLHLRQPIHAVESVLGVALVQDTLLVLFFSYSNCLFMLAMPFFDILGFWVF